MPRKHAFRQYVISTSDGSHTYNFVIGRPDGEEPSFDGQVATQEMMNRLKSMIGELPKGFPDEFTQVYRRLMERNFDTLKKRQISELKVKKVYPGQLIDVWPMSD